MASAGMQAVLNHVSFPCTRAQGAPLYTAAHAYAAMAVAGAVRGYLQRVALKDVWKALEREDFNEVVSCGDEVVNSHCIEEFQGMVVSRGDEVGERGMSIRTHACIRRLSTKHAVARAVRVSGYEDMLWIAQVSCWPGREGMLREARRLLARRLLVKSRGRAVKRSGPALPVGVHAVALGHPPLASCKRSCLGLANAIHHTLTEDDRALKE
eukprot:1137397-Pelagomonas_calceolata.AAC.4